MRPPDSKTDNQMRRTTPNSLLIALLTAVLVACGGGGSESEASPPPTNVAGVALDEPDGTILGSGDGAQAIGLSAQEAFKDRLAALAAPYVDVHGAPGKSVGLVIGVSSPAIRTVEGYGATVLHGTALPTARTVFELGSLTKTYTGVTLGLLANRGTVRLSDTTAAYFPLGAPQYPLGSGSAGMFRLVDLATHTAGLPYMPSNLHYPPASLNPAAGYTVDDLGNFLSIYRLTRAPGSAYLYSNAGLGTLGYALTRAAARSSFDDLIRREIAQPMGLVDTGVVMNAEQRGRSAQGYYRNNGLYAAPANSIGEGLQGAGALRSTGEDVLKFVEAALGQGDPGIVAAWSTAMTPRVPYGSGTDARTGLAINIEDLNGHTVYSKSGATAGFSAEIVFTVSPPAAVVLLANTADTDLRSLGVAVLDMLLK
jgi:CubicO group peptidase (beta-lactamase class C family)